MKKALVNRLIKCETLVDPLRFLNHRSGFSVEHDIEMEKVRRILRWMPLYIRLLRGCE